MKNTTGIINYLVQASTTRGKYVQLANALATDDVDQGFPSFLLPCTPLAFRQMSNVAYP